MQHHVLGGALLRQLAFITLTGTSNFAGRRVADRQQRAQSNVRPHWILLTHARKIREWNLLHTWYMPGSEVRPPSSRRPEPPPPPGPAAANGEPRVTVAPAEVGAPVTLGDEPLPPPVQWECLHSGAAIQ